MLLVLLLTSIVSAQGNAQGTVIFEMADPSGDSNGDGKYTYPTDEIFGDSIEKMLDLTYFKVSNLGKDIEFRLTFDERPDYVKPWDSEGLNHHRIDIYVVHGEEGGRSDTFANGAYVEFKTPWHKMIKVLDFGMSRVYDSTDNPADPNAGSKDVIVKTDNKDIVVTVPKTVIGSLNSDTQFYVLVGLHDGYGEDQYRPILEESGPMVGGGGSNSNYNPNIYDILAETDQDQYNQLGSWEVGRYAVLSPVGGAQSGTLTRVLRYFIPAILIIVAIRLVLAFVKKRR